MPFVRGSEIDKYRQGSFEESILSIKSAIESVLSKSVTMISTHPDKALVVDEDGKFHEMQFALEGASPAGLQKYPADIRVIANEDISSFVAEEIQEIVAEGLGGKVADRTRVRDLFGVVRRGEYYWMSDVVEAIRNLPVDAIWLSEFRDDHPIGETSIELPLTRYTRLPSDKLPKFQRELQESLSSIGVALSDLVDEATALVFDGDGDEKRSAVRGSLIAEAQAAKSLLSKAEKLVSSSDTTRTAEAHDRLAERAKKMVAVLSWLSPRSPEHEE